MHSILDQLIIIGGAEKAGTTSLHTYLAAHPGVVASSKKETDFFRQADPQLSEYLAFFGHPDSHPKGARFLDSSPGYLAEPETSAANIARLAPRARLVFLLRDPIDRLRSSYRFYQSRLHIPQEMSFEQFALACLAHAKGEALPAEAHAIKPWHLRAVLRSRYDQLLKPFEAALPADAILLVHYDDLRMDARATTVHVARVLGLDPAPIEQLEFKRENVSFLTKNTGLQRLAIAVNDGLEGFWRSHPRLKRSLMAVYKRINEKPLEADPLTPDTLARLQAYFEPTARMLASLHRITASH